MFPDSIKYLEQMQLNLSTLNTLQYLTTTHTLHSQAMKKEQVSTRWNKRWDSQRIFLQQLIILTQQSKTFDYLKENWSYDNSIIVSAVTTMVSLIHEAAILPASKNPETWSNYDKAMLQRVPCYDSHSRIYCGGVLTPLAVRSMPFQLSFTFFGADTSSYIQMGQFHLLIISKTVVRRTSGQYVTPQYTSYLVDSIPKQGKKLPTLMKRLKRITKPFVRQ